MSQFSFDPNFNRTINSVETNRSLTLSQLSPTLNEPDYKLISERSINKVYNVVGGNTFSKSALADAFFSSQNMDRLQKLIQIDVYKRSKGKYNIGRQSDNELLLIARATYMLNSHFLETDIKGQVDALNKLVVKDSSEKIMSAVMQHVMYIQDSSSLPIPIPWGKYESTAGTKILNSLPK